MKPRITSLWKKIPLYVAPVLFLASCQPLDERLKPAEEFKLNAPADFDFATIQELGITLATKDKAGKAISVAAIGIYDKNPDDGGTLLYVTGTDETGTVNDVSAIPAHLTSVFIENNIPGVSNVEVPIVNGKVEYTFTSPDLKNGRIAEIPVREYYGFNPTHAGYLMFEDQWPKKGDFDLNDLVLKYNFVETKPTSTTITKLTATFDVVAIGATYDNGFSLHFPKRPNIFGSDQVKSITLTVGGKERTAKVKYAGTGVIIEVLDKTDLTTDFFNTKAEGSCGVQAILTIEFKTAIPIGNVGIPPYDPFLKVFGTNREVHLVNKARTSDAEPLSNFADRDDVDGVYKDKTTGMPFALVVPSAGGFKFKVTTENTPIHKSYTSFAKWANDGGSKLTTDTKAKEWYKYAGSGIINNTCK
jgi:LruC domain-containing protein